MTPCIEEAHRLLHLAERDAQTFGILASHPEASLSAICFHAQQCVEKSLKAVLTAQGTDFPRTHNLEELSRLVAELKLLTPLPARELRKLNPFAVEARYDDEAIPLLTRDEATVIATQMLNWAKEVVAQTPA